MKTYTYNELNDIIKNHVIQLEGVKINGIIMPYIEDIRNFMIKINSNKLINYFDELKQLNTDKNIVDIAATHFIHEGCILTNELIDEDNLLYLGNFKYSEVIKFINLNAIRWRDKRLFLIKWSDGLYTPINLCDNRFPFYADLKETK